MFEKLLSNLPYNPGLLKQITFYARRMRHEESIRRTGMIFVALAFTVQFVAFLAPPQASTAYSSSDMINGGISSKADAVSACKKNIKNYGDALWNFHITCNDVANTTKTTILSTDYNRNIYSLSWLPYGATNPTSGKPTYEQAINLSKVSETIYARRLDSADHKYPVSKYDVLKGTASNGRTFWIMFGCGNLVFVGVPTPAPICRYNGNVYYAGAQECNPPKKCPYNNAIAADSPKCFKPCPYDQSLPITAAKCTVCPYNNKLLKSNPKCPKPCTYNGALPANDKKCVPPCQYDKSILSTDKKCVKPCQYNQNLPADSPQCKPCDASTGSVDTLACLVEHKSAANITQNIADANGTTAQPNDTIVYTLFAQNKGKADIKNFVMQENLNDVLDYANVVDLHGGKKSDSGLVSWPATTIAAGATETHKITVQIKNPLPSTTPPVGDPNHFDHIITNVYGNSVSINLPLPPGAAPVVTAATTTALPNTGPGTGLIIAALVAIIAGYFFARARLLVNESMVVIQETNGGTL